MANDLTFLPAAASPFVSDGILGSRIKLTVLFRGDPVSNSTIKSVELTDDKGNPAGSAQALSPATNAIGDVTIALVSAQPQASLLKLTLVNFNGLSGTHPVTATILDAVTWTSDPEEIKQAVSQITLTASIKKDGQPASGQKLTWTPGSQEFAKYFPRAGFIAKDTNANDPTSYQAELNGVSADDLAALDSKPIGVTLTVGDPDLGLVKPGLIPTQSPLNAPDIGLPGHPHVIDDNLLDAVDDIGVPFRIPAIANARKNDVVQLSGKNADGDTIVMRIYTLSQDDEGLPFIIRVPVDNAAFALNGSLTVTYDVYYPILEQTGTSEELALTVALSHPVGPDGPIDSGLTVLQVSQTVYNKKDYDDHTTLVVTLNFNGDTKPRVGDVVTPVLKLTGYTLANQNWTQRLALNPYTLTAADVVPGVSIIFPGGTRNGFTSDRLVAIEGSNGDLFFDYRPAGGGGNVRSPSRPIIVDTVTPYSGNSVAAWLGRLLAKH